MLFRDLSKGDVIATAPYVIVVNIHNMHGDVSKVPAPLKKASELLENLIKKHSIKKCTIIVCGDFNRNIDYLNVSHQHSKKSSKTMSY